MFQSQPWRALQHVRDRSCRLRAPAHTIYITACREVRSFDVSHQIFDVDIIVVDICDAGIYHFGQIMGRHIRSHTYGDTGSTVDKKILGCGLALRWVPATSRRSWFACLQSLYQDPASFLLNLLQTAFRITHGGCTVTVHRTKVALSVYKHVAHSPRLHIRTRRHIRMESPCGWYLPNTSPTTLADFFFFIGFIRRISQSIIPKRILRWTGLKPSLTSEGHVKQWPTWSSQCTKTSFPPRC